MSKRISYAAWLYGLLACGLGHGAVPETILPEGSAPAALVSGHFPGPRPCVRLAKLERRRTLQAGENTGNLGGQRSMRWRRRWGCRRRPSIPPEMKTRGYITLIRRNWHLLPYDQLLELLEMTPARLAFTLREDDFLWVKLGRLKPKCEPLRYHPPDEAARRARPRFVAWSRRISAMRSAARRNRVSILFGSSPPALPCLPLGNARGRSPILCGWSILMWRCTAIRS